MTESQLIEGQRLQDLINSFKRTLEYFDNMMEEDLKKEISDFLIATSNIPNKDQMAMVMRDAVIESCKHCISQAQEKFDLL